ncbi:hypothetical protein GCM10018780_91640 [Streptomyces lanatus]|nr:hypothetical protein GCM10018780_91640 [Streptomyces lanatus]
MQAALILNYAVRGSEPVLVCLRKVADGNFAGRGSLPKVTPDRSSGPPHPSHRVHYPLAARCTTNRAPGARTSPQDRR